MVNAVSEGFCHIAAYDTWGNQKFCNIWYILIWGTYIT